MAALMTAGATCDVASPDAPLRVFASASLTEAFEEMGNAFAARRPGSVVAVHVAGTPRLATQLREGAEADVFASADERWTGRVRAMRAAAGAARTFATNRMVVAVPPGNPQRLSGLQDLAREELHVALCGPEVPAGRYARQALARAGVTVEPVSDEPSVRALLAKIRLGELDAGIVYATDVHAADGAVDGIAIAPEHAVEARLTLCALDAGNADARAFVDFVLSAAGREILTTHGFGTP